MMYLLTCRSLNSRKRSGWASDNCLARCDVLPPVVSFVHLYHLFRTQSNAIFHFNSSLYLLVSGTLIEFYLFDPSHSFVVTFTGCTAIWEALSPTGELRNSSISNTELSKIMISYNLKYDRYRYFYSTGIPRIPTMWHIKMGPPEHSEHYYHARNLV